MGARALVRIDAGFEGVLGAVLVVGGATGALGADDFPHPVGTAVVVLVGCLLLALAPVLCRTSTPLVTLAFGNAVTAGAALVWLVASSAFSTVGALLLGATIVGLATLAIAQAAAGLRQTASP